MSSPAIGSSLQWIKITKTYVDFLATGTNLQTTIYSLPAKGVIHATYVFLTTGFSGGLIASYTLSVGTALNDTKFFPVTNVFAGSGIIPGLATTAPTPENLAGTTNVMVKALSTVGNLNEATQGSVDIYLLVSTLP